jgi:hydroxymethylglutaryl-CoA lyase/(R)-citramalyl-CoA lyase
VNRLGATGLPRIEAVSFVHPDRVPQMARAETVVGAIDRREGVAYAGLVLNEKGYQRLAATGLDEVHFSFGATESFNLRNANASVEDSLAAAERIAARAGADGKPLVVSISVAFGCPFEGRVPAERVLELAERVVAAGAEEVVLADTIGVAVPRQVRHVVAESTRLGRRVGVHLHNTRSTGFANAYAALQAGATLFDASVGGLGGCPFAPGATGNIATEDLIYLLEGEGVETGVDLDALVEVAAWLEGVLGRELPGQVYRAGGFPAVTASR